jgi:hypothetical protein
MGGLIQGTEYYVRDFIGVGTITVSSTRGGPATALTNDTGTINVTQWKQTNVDRLWVTVNGYRVPSSKLRLNDVNEVSILASINLGDVVIITSMMPSATPDQQVYLNLVDYAGNPSVYSANDETRTWLTRTLGILDTVMYVGDVTSLTQQVVQNVTAPIAVDGYYNIGLDSDKRILTGVTVYNNTTGQYISNDHVSIILVDAAPILKIASGSWITTGNSLTITSLEGNTVYVNGELIRFSSVDFLNNTLSGLERGANGTGAQPIIPQYTDVIGLLGINKLNEIDYNLVWNSYVYNPVDGDPLQISQTVPAEFLNT